jgi:hypothetical protein
VLIIAFVLFVCGAGTALAASGVGSLVANGEDGAVSARGAQQPLGSVSIGDTNTPGENPTVAGDQGAGGAADEVVANNNASPGSGGNSNLPFTGFVAIPLLLLGAGMLVGGVVLRRRSPQPV